MKSPASKQWETAITAEYANLKETGTFKWVEKLPEGRKAVGSRIVFREKRDGDGRITKYKARIVAKGFSQVPGEDFTETFSSVAKFTTLRAFLRGDLDEEIYMDVPEGVREEGKKGWRWKLLKALYGLKQAGRQWKAKLDESMTSLGFEKSEADDCLYICRENTKVVLLVLVYVDDMAVAGRSVARIQTFKSDMAKRFDITDLGEHCLKSNRVHPTDPFALWDVRMHPNFHTARHQARFILRAIAEIGRRA